MTHVKHNTWFLLEIDGQEYRAKWKDHGFSYATLRIDTEETYTVCKYVFFGSKITKKRWLNIIRSSREEAADASSVKNKQLFYNANDTRRQVQNIVLRIHKEHTIRI